MREGTKLDGPMVPPCKSAFRAYVPVCRQAQRATCESSTAQFEIINSSELKLLSVFSLN